jgi:5-methyltetrahydrofolate--homocysteine methyltransferase
MDVLATLRERTVILDGAMGTELLAHGFSTRECPELWNVTNPDVVADIHRGYFAAGSDVVHTNTFGGTRPKLAAYHCQERTQELNEAGARLAVGVRDEVAPGRLVAGDVGSTGRLLKPMGDTDPRELEEVFAEQVEALARGGVDLVSIETMFDLEEARIAVKAAREVCRLPVSVSMTYNRAPRGYRTMMGVTPQQAVEVLLTEGADVVGTNCTLTAHEMVELVGELRRVTDGLLLAEPNAGQPHLEAGHTVYEETAEHFAEGAVEIVAQGADLIGGCCGTNATFIATLVAALGPRDS